LKHISHHILGDTKYGRGEHNKLIRSEFGMHRLLLHVKELHIKHPYTNEALVLKVGYDIVFEKVFEAFGWEL